MSIETNCPNGHRLRTDDVNAGKTGRCPVCKVAVMIPVPVRKNVTESAVVEILGELNAQASQNRVGRTVMRQDSTPAPTRNASASRLKTCPNCEQEIDLGYHICPNCHAYLVGLNEF